MALYFIKYTKEDIIKFVGHLDLLRAIQRNITRADLNIAYSHGFNPHMQMSIGQPLPVGVKSRGEYMTCTLDTAKTEGEILTALNQTAPSGIRYLFVKKVPDAMKTPMALLRGVKSRILIPSDEARFQTIMEVMDDSLPMMYAATSKKGVESEKDLRPLIVSHEIARRESVTELTLVTKAGSKAHLSLNHLLDYLDQVTGGLDKNRFISVERLEMYTEVEGQLVAMDDYARENHGN